MADYLLLYQNGEPDWAERPPEEIQRVMEEWGAWFQRLEASGNLRNGGAALAPGGAVLTRNGDSIQTDTAMSEVKELVGGFSILAADSLEQATELAKGSPFLGNNPNGNIVVRPVLEMES